MNYKLIRSILFKLDPELSHKFSLKAIKLLDLFNGINWLRIEKNLIPKKVFGLTFANPVGLAAGLDKDGDYIDCLAKLGFGFIEIGTVTPKPQQGNPRPRLFRLDRERAIINRMGFNNKGVDYLVNRLKEKKYEGVLGINIGKNASTPIENAVNDYLICFDKVYSYASYVTINISSPNTLGLRNLQRADYLSSLLSVLKDRQMVLANQYNRYVPLVVKVAPDLSNSEIKDMAKIFCEFNIDGIIATNTTVDRAQIKDEVFANEAGGLSGDPLYESSTKVLKEFKQLTASHQIPLIASGGIMSKQQAMGKITAGADLIQLYTGFIYEGPSLISECCKLFDSDARSHPGI